eukprot:gnl/TRDRNA2_/TRDRNA2_169904_c0_seq4.p1 gnl/TRDRNA2_/TRDRNA2_169904_c0~~gnl/TRDRNA2_/TRDRNA2_169904_c0_seq4.p1  ORF type:complete len:165 (-),score=19.13 gnl/TRDRNA2_/TRDRNA2_169904_c0_seq4:26-520(-)
MILGIYDWSGAWEAGQCVLTAYSCVVLVSCCVLAWAARSERKMAESNRIRSEMQRVGSIGSLGVITKQVVKAKEKFLSGLASAKSKAQASGPGSHDDEDATGPESIPLSSIAPTAPASNESAAASTPVRSPSFDPSVRIVTVRPAAARSATREDISLPSDANQC